MDFIRYLRPAALVAMLLSLAPLTGYAAPLNDAKAVPHLDSTGQTAYRDFLAADRHRAFAIAPGGAWTWNAGGSNAKSIADDTLQTCEFDNGQRCILYALDDKVVFDSKVWNGLWGPYLDRATADRARIGLQRGERFHNLAFKSPAGKAMKLSDLRGKVIVLHFWGSWCPPCRREMPDMQQLHRALGKSPGIEMVLLQVREDIDTARKWAGQRRLQLPLYDSGANGKASEFLPLADGKSIHDRYIAEVFPTTYILDKHGIIVFSHVGLISRWPEFLPLLRDVAARSGK
ncbi:MAG: TlpA family protein disulfide reductase [Gammaproteobacteria bacterium]|nr:TlpA family protein disulfide reductase [Gammaproteobacteria bacterium]MBU1967835.1 TlpA family protein disulfide reductase [Gammaproteobacteria bacterium]